MSFSAASRFGSLLDLSKVQKPLESFDRKECTFVSKDFVRKKNNTKKP